MDVGWLGMMLAELGSFARANKARVNVFQKKKKKKFATFADNLANFSHNIGT